MRVLVVVIITLLQLVYHSSLHRSIKNTIAPIVDEHIFQSSSSSSSSSRFGLRINANNVTKQVFDRYYDGIIPIVITNVFDFDRKAWIDRLLCSLGDCDIEYDQRLYIDNDNDKLYRYEAKLKDFIDCVTENSDHYDNIYMMDEAILSKDPELLHPLDLSWSHLYKCDDDVSDTKIDLFTHFPSKIRPSIALIIGRDG